jgi:IS30 family transposase
MSQDHCTTRQLRFKHLTERERYQIEILIKEKKNAKDIAAAIGKSKRTIERELVRGTVSLLTSELEYKDQYCADAAQRVYLERATAKGPGLKIGNDHALADYIEMRIVHDRYAPDAVIGEIRAKKLEFKASICTKTLYNYIDQGVFANITNRDLPVKKYKSKGKYKKVRICHNNLRGTSIEERPAEIETREEYGHWEMDCVVGKQGGSGTVLLVLTERSSRQEIIRKMDDKTQQSVIKIMDKLETKYKKHFGTKFKTITVDNGSEFLDQKGLEKSLLKEKQLRFKLYYAHPYSSWERGSNENNNRLIRRFVPKGTDIGNLSQREIQRIENWMNNYPRKLFGYKTANEMAA